MAAPYKNQNHLTYSPEKIRQLFFKAIKAIQNDEQIFNYPSLHRAIHLKTLRTLPYLAEKNKGNLELMQLWNTVKTGLERNLLKRLENDSVIEIV